MHGSGTVAHLLFREKFTDLELMRLAIKLSRMCVSEPDKNSPKVSGWSLEMDQ
jgi:hypothetical protein